MGNGDPLGKLLSGLLSGFLPGQRLVRIEHLLNNTPIMYNVNLSRCFLTKPKG